MTSTTVPPLGGVDHVHIHVTDRPAALAWYQRVLGFDVVPELAAWQAGGGPLTVADAAGTVHLALFESPAITKNRAVVALRTDAEGFAAWRRRLAGQLPQPPSFEDHDMSLSIYFRDPDGNPFEITTYEVAAARAAMA
jgi:catechol-2,3-dioxygenase